MQQNKRLNILFPVETLSRELDFRLFLACLHSHRGNRIFIGQPDVLYDLAKHMEGGLYVGKNIFIRLFPDTELERYRTLKKNQFTLIHLDEEGAVYAGDEDDWRHLLKQRLDPTCLASDDYVCTWGEFQRQFYQSLDPECHANIRTTGHPRFDLYRPTYRAYFKEDADLIRQRYGEFILVNTNLTYANNGLGLASTFSGHLNYDPGDSDNRLRHVRKWAGATETLCRFIQLITRLSIELGDTNIVVRPHPGESQAFYETVFRGVRNVHVVLEGPVAPWIIASRLLIHDGCTTAIEAHLADAFIISYRSQSESAYQPFLPNTFGTLCLTEDQVLQSAVNILSSNTGHYETGTPDTRAVMLLNNLKQEAFPNVLGILSEAEQRHQDVPRCPSQAELVVGETRRRLAELGRSTIRPLFPKKAARHRFLTRNHFSGFAVQDIDRRIGTIQTVIGKSINHRCYSESLICIEACD